MALHVFGAELYPLRVVILLFSPLFFLYPSSRILKITKQTILLFSMMLGYGIVSLAWSPDPMLGFRNATWLFTGVILLFLIVRQARDQKTLRQIMMLWAISIIGTSLLGFYESFSGQYLFQFDVTKLDGMDEYFQRIGWWIPRVFWNNWNNFAFVNAISGLVLLGWGLDSRGRDRILGLTSSCLAVVIVVICISRAAIGGLLVGLVVFGAIHAHFLIKHRRFKTKHGILLILVMVMSTGVFISQWENINFANKIYSSFSAKLEGSIESNDYREFTYKQAFVEGTWGSLGFGRGLGASTKIIDGKSYHFYPLEVLAEFGMWVFLGNVFLVFTIISGLYRCIVRGIHVYWSTGLLASVLAFPLLSMGPSSILAEAPYWLWMGLLVAFLGVNNSKALSQASDQ